MNNLKAKLQKHINTEITIEFGCIGSNYSQILIVDNGKIKSIGEFIYRVFLERLAEREEGDLISDLGIECEKYRINKREKKPSLCFYKEELKVI